MIRYIPSSENDIKDMLETLGLKAVDELFTHIPQKYLLQNPLQLPPPLSEVELMAHLRVLSKKNADSSSILSLIGGGAYHHWVPSVVDEIASRSEFATSYTPYQPEVSQGTLQAIFEFQSMIGEITAMEIANASLYDGASASAEGALMAHRLFSKERGDKILVAETLNPEYMAVCSTYFEPLGIEAVPVSYSQEGSVDLKELQNAIKREGKAIFAILLQTPNFFGIAENLSHVAKLAKEAGVALVVAVAEAVSLGILPRPGKCGADIVVGEAQALGNPLQYGGPYVGFLAAKKKDVRQVPGRIVGATRDVEGKRAFTLTLTTREQHIRRERATSNICTNQGLCALRTTIYLSLLGKKGFHEVAYQNYAKSEYAKRKISELRGMTIPFSGASFNEWVLTLNVPSSSYLDAMRDEGILAGIAIDSKFSKLRNSVLVTFTELISRDEIDHWVNVSKRVLGSLRE